MGSAERTRLNTPDESNAFTTAGTARHLLSCRSCTCGGDELLEEIKRDAIDAIKAGPSGSIPVWARSARIEDLVKWWWSYDRFGETLIWDLDPDVEARLMEVFEVWARTGQGGRKFADVLWLYYWSSFDEPSHAKVTQVGRLVGAAIDGCLTSGYYAWAPGVMEALVRLRNAHTHMDS